MARRGRRDARERELGQRSARRRREPRQPPQRREQTNGHLRLGTYRSIWASPEVEISPALQFTIAEQLVELSPEDARGSGSGMVTPCRSAQNGTRVNATAHIRTGVPVGTAFLAAGIAKDSANALTEPLVEVRRA